MRFSFLLLWIKGTESSTLHGWATRGLFVKLCFFRIIGRRVDMPLRFGLLVHGIWEWWRRCAISVEQRLHLAATPGAWLAPRASRSRASFGLAGVRTS